jgi:hypothetical protein
MHLNEWIKIAQNTPEYVRAFQKFMNASNWAEAIYYLGMCADLEGLPLRCGEREDGTLYACVGEDDSDTRYGIDGIEGNQFFYIGG